MCSDKYSVEDCERCSELCSSRSQIVNGVGDESADVVFVGEAPGKNEDERGEPFVGKSGNILDDALEKSGAVRNDVWITNLVRCRPPDNRDPMDVEVSNCGSYLEEELQFINPDCVVPLGRIPCSFFVEDSFKITEVAGESISVDKYEFDVVLCMHPAATIYDKSLRPLFNDIVESVVEGNYST